MQTVQWLAEQMVSSWLVLHLLCRCSGWCPVFCLRVGALMEHRIVSAQWIGLTTWSEPIFICVANVFVHIIPIINKAAHVKTPITAITNQPIVIRVSRLVFTTNHSQARVWRWLNIHL